MYLHARALISERVNKKDSHVFRCSREQELSVRRSCSSFNSRTFRSTTQETALPFGQSPWRNDRDRSLDRCCEIGGCCGFARSSRSVHAWSWVLRTQPNTGEMDTISMSFSHTFIRKLFQHSQPVLNRSFNHPPWQVYARRGASRGGGLYHCRVRMPGKKQSQMRSVRKASRTMCSFISGLRDTT